MTRALLEILVCPACRGDLVIDSIESEHGGDIESGSLRCATCGTVYPIVRFIPRFVPAANYAGSFGFQWNRFPRTQLDSHSGHPITRTRFFSQSRWTEGELRDRLVLDVGCGSGRFAEIALSAGARVVAMDYSNAVDAARENLHGNHAITFIQADVFHMPFRDGAFDYVYCFGVLQHTPDPHGAFSSMLAPLRRGGRIAIDVYPKTWTNAFQWKYWLRPFAKRVPSERLFVLVERMVRSLLPLSVVLGRTPLVGRALTRLLPVMNYDGIYPLTRKQHYEWSVLDTFDMYSPAHDHPQTAATLRSWLAGARLREGEAVREGLIILRGTK